MLPGPAAKHRSRFPRNRVSQAQVLIVILLFVSTIGGLVTFVTRRCEHCTTAPCRELHNLPVAAQDGTSTRRRLAVVIPYRDRLDHLRTMLPITRACLRRSNAGASLSAERLAECVGLVESSSVALQPVEYLLISSNYASIFVMEQAPGLHFNRGALLNAAALFLKDSSYDCLVFHDVDTVCSSHENVAYRCPLGAAPLHLTPPGLHPRDNFPEFLGGNIVFTQGQFQTVNGFQHSFWGWGKEDNNMVRRLQLHHMWPPERPTVKIREKDFYWVHLEHEREVVVKIADPATRNREAVANLEPRVHDDNRSGLRETRFRVLSIEPFLNATRVVVQLACNRQLTPWCDKW